jgi:ribosomal protein L37AE/L43A
MYNKLCPWCERRSYSATTAGIWNCPYCGEDITSAPAATGYTVLPPEPEPKSDPKKETSDKGR